MKAFICISTLLLVGTAGAAQTLIGIWRGNRTQATGGCFPYYSMELHIYHLKDNSFSGNAYSFYDKEKYTKINFSGTFDEASQRLAIVENTVLKYNIPSQCIPCIKTYELKWSANGKEYLDGEWKGHEWGSNTECPPGQIHLMKATQPVFPVEIFQNDSLVTLQRALSLPIREKEMVQEIRTRQSDVSISIIDNGDVDGDTVSVFLNNTLLLHHRALSRTPLLLDLNLFPNTDYDLSIFAENQGTIPPNTSLMTVTCGNKRYELRMSSNEKKSATVRFRYEQ
jgi:hypothetical protein